MALEGGERRRCCASLSSDEAGVCALGGRGDDAAALELPFEYCDAVDDGGSELVVDAHGC